MSTNTHKLSHRRFSESVKRSVIKDLDNGLLRVIDIVRSYSVHPQTVYNWREKYSVHYQRKTRLVVEKRSEGTQKQALESRIAELEAALGRKQMELDYKNKLIELMGEELKMDLEKKGGQTNN
ncbi:MAG TPA: hypothetical protein DCE41_28400 [Cytophagales bacterium]|nr:hypothetical protein [Cytophagales bacterium]HAA21432.1 hypothetical protein [Cytophagales bacterium]HAP58393.1 hypothetical protein [Cytophagales bacterium]